MKSFNPTIIVLVVLSLTTGNFALAQNQPRQKTLTITGSAQLPGVTMTGLPGNIITDQNGYYQVTVNYGWSGRVIPRKEGYKFEPSIKLYTPLTRDLANEDYSAEIVQFTIIGNTRIGGVEMNGLPGNPVTDKAGYYSVRVDYGWHGTATPVKEGFVFEPPSLSYAALKNNQANQNYIPRTITFTVSGTTDTSGVTMTGLPGTPVTDESGYYIGTVPYGFSGTIKPVKKGHTFEPARRMYTRVIANQPNGNYAAEGVMLTISGRLVLGGHPMEGVLISADNDGGSDTTDPQGRYKLRAPYGWSGKITPLKYGIHFNPPSMTFTNVTTNMVDGEPERLQGEEADPFGDFRDSPSRSRSRGSDRYSSSPRDSRSSRSRARSTSAFKPTVRSGNRRVLVIPAGEVQAKEFAETTEDMHVMSHILDEGFKETRRIQGFFTDFGAFFGRDNRSTEATYLQGYGVLFLMEVNFAFSPPPRKQAQDPTETTEAADSTWQKARQQVLSPGASPGMDQEDSARDYDNQMVEELKKELVEALKHASNIRNIEPDEWVILTVIGGQRQFGMGFGGGLPAGGGMSGFRSSSGSAGSSGGMMGGSYGGGMMSGGYGGGGMIAGMGGMMGGGVVGGFGTTASSASTVLTIRAKKTSVDDFAKGALDFEQFQKEVKILMY